MHFRIGLNLHVRIRASIEQGLDEAEHAIRVWSWNGGGLLIAGFHRQVERRPAFGVREIDIRSVIHQIERQIVVAVLHGNQYAPDKKVILAFERTPDGLVITIRDQGKGIDLSGIPNPLAPENLLKTSGRGIFLMRSFMDEVEIRPSKTGTEVKLIKHVHGSSVGNKEGSQ